MKEVKISQELRDYIEMLDYEKQRYKDLLTTITRDCCPMTDEEWNSSLEYYKNLCCEADIKFGAIIESIEEMFADDINGEEWAICYPESILYIGEGAITKAIDPSYVHHHGRGEETYAEQLTRYYPLKEKKEMSINDDNVKSITMQVTDACNLCCTYCYQHNKGNHSMSWEVAKEFIDMILAADERSNSYIDANRVLGVTLEFIGGEPWLEVDLISKISDYFIGELFRRKHPWMIKFCFDVCSNGLLHFDPRVQAYLNRHGKHCSYNISIDGNKELHDKCRIDHNGNGSYDRAIAGVMDYRNKFKRYIGSKVTISPDNVYYLFEAVKSLIDNGYYSINLNYVYEKGWELEHAKVLYWELHKLTDWLKENDLIEKINLSIFNETVGSPMLPEDNNNWCGGVGFMMAVDWKGDIYPCLRYMESSVTGREPYIIGNIYEGISQSKATRSRLKCFECVTRRSQSTDECFNCPIASGCGWCSAYNYECFGTANKRATFICEMHKARSLANCYYWFSQNVHKNIYCPKEWAINIIGEEEYKKLIDMENALLENNE